MGPRYSREEFERRFWARVKRTAGCWFWLGPLHNGYGRVRYFDGTATNPHRASYMLLKGPIPEGLQLDHLCRVRNCVNPAHLEPVTPRENTFRGNSPSVANAAKTHCVRGHPYSSTNTYVDATGSRHCRACGREKAAERRNDPTKYYRLHHRPMAQRKRNYLAPCCKRGHLFTLENTYWRAGGNGRQCRACRRLIDRKRGQFRRRVPNHPQETGGGAPDPVPQEGGKRK
jgi:hypothetical protein